MSGFPDMVFRRARQDEADAVRNAYDLIRDHLAVTVDFRHWHTENHPSPDQIDRWIAQGDLYVATRDQAHGRLPSIAGVVVLDHTSAEDYGAATWAVDAEPERVLIVHALGVVPDSLGTGVSRFLIESALEVARERGCLAVRLDVIADNTPAHKLYRRSGFTDLGLHTIRYGGTDLDQFHLYEYVLEHEPGSVDVESMPGPGGAA